MATKIRLARGGSKKRPYYRVIVADSAAPRDGKFIEKVGTYNPLLAKDNAERINLKADRIEHWLSVGAVPTEKVALFIKAAGLGKGNTVLAKIEKKRNNVIELKKVEIAAKKKIQAEELAAKEAEKKAAEELAAKEEAEKKAAEEEAAKEEAEKKAAEEKAAKEEAEKKAAEEKASTK